MFSSVKLFVTFWLSEAVRRCRVRQRPSHSPAARRGALIEPADLTFVSLTLRGASAPCLDHNTISTSEPVTSAAGRSRREAEGASTPGPESVCFPTAASWFLFFHSSPNYTARNRHKSVFRPLAVWTEREWQFKINVKISSVVVSGNTLWALDLNGSRLCCFWK